MIVNKNRKLKINVFRPQRYIPLSKVLKSQTVNLSDPEKGDFDEDVVYPISSMSKLNAAAADIEVFNAYAASTSGGTDSAGDSGTAKTEDDLPAAGDDKSE